MATVASPQRPPHSHSRSRSPTKHDAYLPSSPSPFPSSPSLTDLRPNAHPYPIATTATGVLTRSNSLSSPSAGNGGRHHYVPPSPGASPTHARITQTASNNTKDGAGAGRERRTEYRGHRYSRSLSNSEDNTRAYGESSGGGNVNGPRALPVPPGVSANSIAAKEAARKGGWSAYAGGPSPKRWTPAQLAAHLDRTISPEAGAWAARSNVGGKAFMRMREEELEAMGPPRPDIVLRLFTSNSYRTPTLPSDSLCPYTAPLALPLPRAISETRAKAAAFPSSYSAPLLSSASLLITPRLLTSTSTSTSTSTPYRTTFTCIVSPCASFCSSTAALAPPRLMGGPLSHTCADDGERSLGMVEAFFLTSFCPYILGF
ncbi:hypothetical protein C8R46DRAFT_1209904 [Mycena filopes]|nr:hypothetical protein C8R46DRAFT_1209904 [Mycena filopes]